MTDLDALAAEYRATAAGLAVKLRRMRAEGAEQYRINHMVTVLNETRQMAHALSHYYDAPRDPVITGAGYYARKGKNRDD